MLFKKQTRAKKLRNVLGEVEIQLNHSECIDVLSKLQKYPDLNSRTARTRDKQTLAEQFLDEILEGELELNYKIFTQRFEEKYLVNFTESIFLREMRNQSDDVGDYIRRDYMGCLSGRNNHGDDRYPNHVRYVWRGFYEKNEALIIVGVYHKKGTYYVCSKNVLG